MLGRRSDRKLLNPRPNAALSRNMIMRKEDDKAELKHSENEKEKQFK